LGFQRQNHKNLSKGDSLRISSAKILSVQGLQDIKLAQKTPPGAIISSLAAMVLAVGMAKIYVNGCGGDDA
jgi:hypothetical protein